MAVTSEDVRNMAGLARLRLDPGEIDTLTTQLRSILAHVAHLEAADSVSDDEGADATRFAAPPRADWPDADPLTVSPDAFAIAWQDGFFTVPRLAAMDPGEDEAGAA